MGSQWLPRGSWACKQVKFLQRQFDFKMLFPLTQPLYFQGLSKRNNVRRP